ncbi:MAG: hypothetical protein DRI44_01995 [Chlamydiae bacterium]|nr:MAG: hypothetical protein DRI44_01995 [Chlamydiota bacterium]
MTEQDKFAIEKIISAAEKNGLDVKTGKIRRTSSRFCLGVEHGDYNGTELFGVGTDRFIWMAYKPNGTNKSRFFSVNFPEDGVVEFETGKAPEPKSVHDSWARFPLGVDYILHREGFNVSTGIDAVLFGNIPGGGMSRSASLSLNLILTILEINKIEMDDKNHIVDLAQMVENDYIGSPCGILDQTMILFAKKGMGTHYNPADRSIKYILLGKSDEEFRIVSLDTGTVRPGLEKSTYKIRKEECDELVELLKDEFEISCLADVKTQELYDRIIARVKTSNPDLCDRLDYIFHAQQRFYKMIAAWKTGDIAAVGKIFRTDGLSLRDKYKISGPELETMCDIARTVPGVFGERMLGGGDKGAAGAIVRMTSVEKLKYAIETAYPRSHPDLADKFAVHSCKIVDGVKEWDMVWNPESIISNK